MYTVVDIFFRGIPVTMRDDTFTVNSGRAAAFDKGKKARRDAALRWQRLDCTLCRMRKSLLIGVGAGTVLCLAACGGGKSGSGKTEGLGQSMSGDRPQDLKVPRVDPSLCKAEGNDRRIAAYDLNHDDRADAWKIFKIKEERGTKVEVMTCKQVDLDHDPQSRKDYVVEYDDAGNMILEEFDFDFDGKFDARRHYDANTQRKILVERNTDFDEKPDLWEEYDKMEKVDRVLRDRNGDGKPDYWELFRDGTLETILYDDDFDGKVDKREDATTAPPEATPPPPGTVPTAPGAAPPAGAPPAETPATTPPPAGATPPATTTPPPAGKKPTTK
jgi:hypothetical protein